MPGTRIRAYKPEFFTLPSTEPLSFPARLLRLAMMNWANDHGIGETNLNGLLGLAFPDADGFTANDVRGFLCEIAQHCDVVFYTVRGRHYFQIADWDDHQQIKKRNRQAYPLPDDDGAIPDQRFYADAPYLRAIPGNTGESAGTRGDDVVGTGEQGIRGTEEQRSSGTGEQRNGVTVEPRISGAADQ
jgi:hypothetical protein